MTTKEKVLVIIFLLLAVPLFVFILSGSIKKHEAMECRQWIKQAQEIDGFYWTDWQIEQCSNY